VIQPNEELVDYWKRTGPKVLWGTMLRHELEAALATRPVVFVPIGSVEQHGPACPQDVDIVDAYAVCLRAAQRIDDFSALVVPPVWYGLAPFNMGWIGTITLELETAVGLLNDICVSLHSHGFRKVVLVNGHGGNVPLMGVVATKLSQRSIYVGYTNIWDLGREVMQRVEERDGGRIGHGGEMESSIQLYLRPFLMDVQRAVSEPITAMDVTQRHPLLGLVELLRETASGVMGDGTSGTGDKGKAFIEGASTKLIEVARWFRDSERVARGYLDPDLAAVTMAGTKK
jgi:creatinine amidohydrolase